MPTVEETAGAKQELAAGLAAGVNTLSLNQTITFKKYVQVVLPLDGFVFWVNSQIVNATPTANGSGTITAGGVSQQVFAATTSRTRLFIQNPDDAIEDLYVNLRSAAGPTSSIQLSPGGQYQESGYSAPSDSVWVYAETTGHAFVAMQGGANIYGVTNPIIQVKGSLHYSTNQSQEEDGSVSSNAMIFTAEEEVNPFNEIGPQEMYIATFDGIRFAFNSRVGYYQQADLHHYRGHALYSVMDSQIIDDPSDFNLNDLIVSNSLPIWLSLNAKMPVFPSYLVPVNTPPPYASVHIEPRSTTALQSAPFIDLNGSHWQLAKETVRYTIYGLNNNEALDFQDYILNASLPDNSPFGIMNIPIIQDDKRTQTEMQILAQKKTFTLEISYYQIRMQDIAMQLILHCIPTFTVS